MRTVILWMGNMGVLLTAAGAPAQRSNTPPVALFNGQDLSGWYGLGHFDPHKLAALSEADRAQLEAAGIADINAHWSVVDGDLVNDGQGLYLTTKQAFGDVELWVDYKTVPLADSGIYLRGSPQVQIWDTTEAGGKWDMGADKGSGGLWNNSVAAAGKDPLVLADKPFGQWNRLRMRQIGARTSVWLNDQRVVDHAIMENYWDRSRPLIAKGPIQLQTHGGEIRWRNIFARTMPADEANELLAEVDAHLFEPIFNGKDLTGWEGATDSYEVKDTAIVCKPGHGGTIFTTAEYEDFVVRFEFKMPPGGNNGLAIRYPGEGDAAYTGMCELQVLDSEHEKYADLDARQYHGSAYGMAAAHRGYLRPAGQWNFQEVTVQGARIRVELNGTIILDTDLSKISGFMSDAPHPGKNRTSGHFGFAGHNDPVEFRRVQIKRL